jgi:hypothetical protein
MCDLLKRSCTQGSGHKFTSLKTTKQTTKHGHFGQEKWHFHQYMVEGSGYVDMEEVTSSSLVSPTRLRPERRTRGMKPAPA